MLTILCLCLAALAILTHFLYWAQGQKPWLKDCLYSILYVWVLNNIVPISLHLMVDEPNSVESRTASVSGDINPSEDKPFDPSQVKSSDIDTLSTCSIGSGGGCGSMGPSHNAPPGKPISYGPPNFTAPAHGRLIQDFATGGDGINIALRTGTPVRAIEYGEVAYAGGSLRGYGNMILIRHANGYVSAYAHNSELTVKLGDKVERGQTIAKSGQTGNVGSPQLHFELRKGSKPVDPTVYLTGLI